MEIILTLLKIDLGITHNLRDAYFISTILAAQKEIEYKRITLDLSNVEDQMLLSDYAAWKYRKRQEDVGLPQNLTYRLRNRVVKARSQYAET
ncbi:hypothetical protein [Clostridium sp. BNL1100]|uniref:hypothetical protein n=1 Tax=Clostridium sp. BNL1100 TaxID=755731 RepID=UPI00024A78C8|nr:hypothetical protein [Clostridium sp. BNL1100]AEY64827.1 hypothetical protein Clo1100_0548 [Clostridium sp. BNL1100]